MSKVLECELDSRGSYNSHMACFMN